jgi:hypothetical protein
VTTAKILAVKTGTSIQPAWLPCHPACLTAHLNVLCPLWIKQIHMLVPLIIVKKLKAICNNMWKKILLAGPSKQRGVGSSKPILIILKWGRMVVSSSKRVFPARTNKTMNCFYFEFEKRSSVRTYKPWLAHFSKKLFSLPFIFIGCEKLGMSYPASSDSQSSWNSVHIIILKGEVSLYLWPPVCMTTDFFVFIFKTD